MASKQQLKSKIRATLNIKQITKAMQMVAASKMRKAEEAALAARPYAKKALELLRGILNVAANEELRSPYFGETEGKCVCVVVATADKGLCGAYNSAVLRSAAKFVDAAIANGATVEVVAIGKKGKDFFERRGVTVAGHFTRFSEIATLYDADPVAQWIIAAFAAKTYDRVVYCGTAFLSALVQKAGVSDLLPLTLANITTIIKSIIPKTGRYSGLQDVEKPPEKFYIFEPSKTALIEELTLYLVRVAVLHLILEANASEHAARMVAMKSATENAEEVAHTLTMALNKARQETITAELIEMSSAREAMAG